MAKEKSRRSAAILTRPFYHATALKHQSRRFFFCLKIQRRPFNYASFPAAIGGCHCDFIMFSS